VLENACAECSKACFQSAQEHVFARVVMVLTLVYSIQILHAECI
jgi:hypothetical protein